MRNDNVCMYVYRIRTGSLLHSDWEDGTSSSLVAPWKREMKPKQLERCNEVEGIKEDQVLPNITVLTFMGSQYEIKTMVKVDGHTSQCLPAEARLLTWQKHYRNNALNESHVDVYSFMLFINRLYIPISAENTIMSILLIFCKESQYFDGSEMFSSPSPSCVTPHAVIMIEGYTGTNWDT